jgi:hypothetical protein
MMLRAVREIGTLALLTLSVSACRDLDSDTRDAGSEEDSSYVLNLVNVFQEDAYVAVNVSVTKNGTPVKGLTPADFTLSTDAGPISEEASHAISFAALKRWRTLILVDASSSSSWAGAYDQLFGAAEAYARLVAGEDSNESRVAIAEFDGAGQIRAVTAEYFYPGRAPFEGGNGLGTGALIYTSDALRIGIETARYRHPTDCSVDTDCSATKFPNRPKCLQGLCINQSTNLAVLLDDGIIFKSSGDEYQSIGPMGLSLVTITDGKDEAKQEDLLERIHNFTNEYRRPTSLFAIGPASGADDAVLKGLGAQGLERVGGPSGFGQAVQSLFQRQKALMDGVYSIRYCTPLRATTVSHLIIGVKGGGNTVAARHSGVPDPPVCDAKSPPSPSPNSGTCGMMAPGLLRGTCKASEVCLTSNKVSSCQTGEITDSEGLHWQMNPSLLGDSFYLLAEAETYCQGLGGSFRLPTMAELKARSSCSSGGCTMTPDPAEMATAYIKENSDLYQSYQSLRRLWSSTGQFDIISGSHTAIEKSTEPASIRCVR